MKTSLFTARIAIGIFVAQERLIWALLSKIVFLTIRSGASGTNGISLAIIEVAARAIRNATLRAL